MNRAEQIFAINLKLKGNNLVREAVRGETSIDLTLTEAAWMLNVGTIALNQDGRVTLKTRHDWLVYKIRIVASFGYGVIARIAKLPSLGQLQLTYVSDDMPDRGNPLA
ncbi:MAG: hypothetical protein LBI39_03135 [Puniceicoccales bacterium]|jgi:hypothetical protein|nr:hypothetical protein [Puniceicoccales bacterium]